MKDSNLLAPDLHDFSDLGFDLSGLSRVVRSALRFVARLARGAGSAALGHHEHARQPVVQR